MSERPSYTIALPIEVGPDGDDYLPAEVRQWIAKTAVCLGAEFHGQGSCRPVIFFFENTKARARMVAKLSRFEP